MLVNQGQAGEIVFEVWNKENKEVKIFRFSLDDKEQGNHLKNNEKRRYHDTIVVPIYLQNPYKILFLP